MFRPASSSLRRRFANALTGRTGDGKTAVMMRIGAHVVLGHSLGRHSVEKGRVLAFSFEDMLKYLKANVGAPATSLQRAMRAAHEPRKQIDGASIGLGWQMRSYQGRTLITHGGGTAGFSTMVSFDPDKRVGFVMLVNQGQFQDDVCDDFLRRAEGGGEPPIPESSISKPPSAELRPGQLDSDSLPPYDVLDDVLDDYVEQDRGLEELVEAGFDRDLAARVLKMTDTAEYKRRQYPPGPKISLRAFGRDRRLPITNRWTERVLPRAGETAPEA